MNLAALTAAEEQATVGSLEKLVAKDPAYKYAKAALVRHRLLLESLDSQRKKWDIVVRTFSAKDRADLQRIASEGLKEFQEIARVPDHQLQD